MTSLTCPLFIGEEIDFLVNFGLALRLFIIKKATNAAMTRSKNTPTTTPTIMYVKSSFITTWLVSEINKQSIFKN